MNRRNLLKQAGMMVLAAPALKAVAFDKCGAAMCQPAGKKPLIVRVVGPFGYELIGPDMQNIQHVLVMAPQVGLDNKKSPHVPWLGTTSNECRFIGFPKDGPEYELILQGYTPNTQFPTPIGTPSWFYPPPPGATKRGESPMFTIKLPVPDSIIGINPTCVCLGKIGQQCTAYQTFSSGISFVYNNVDLDLVRVKSSAIGYDFHPCFANDATLSDATLEMHLTPLKANQVNHDEAKAAFRRMVAMYPWIDENDIEFSFDPCPPNTATFGSGADCKVCGVIIPPPSGPSNKK
ncbi:MAG TPA: hypothetical protein VG759_11235 [Candidatus Angelobacter sp.]|jgi:hypothetical protein|nr:hypothetical protein [Candidatus Angelobacter sp.]